MHSDRMITVFKVGYFRAIPQASEQLGYQDLTQTGPWCLCGHHALGWNSVLTANLKAKQITF